MNLTLIRSMTRSAVFELENELCYRPAHPFTVALNGKTIYEACNTNVFSLFSLLPGTTYTVEVQAEGETLKLDFTTEAETFFVDAARYGLVADGETDNTVRLQAALSTCPKGGTVYVPAGRYRTASLFMKSNTTLYLEKGAVLLGDNDRTHYPILPGVLPSENEVDEYYLTGWEGNPLDSFAGLLNITQVHDVVVTGEGTLDCDAQQTVFPHLQGAAALAYQQKGAHLLVCRQLQPAAGQPHGVCLYLGVDLFPFRFHFAHPFRKQPSQSPGERFSS